MDQVTAVEIGTALRSEPPRWIEALSSAPVIFCISLTQLHQQWELSSQWSVAWSVSTGVSPTAALSADRIPTYSVGELNAAVGPLERGFAPRFLAKDRFRVPS